MLLPVIYFNWMGKLLQLPHMVLKETSLTYTNLDGKTGVNSERKARSNSNFKSNNSVVLSERWRMREMKRQKLSSISMDASLPVRKSGASLLRSFNLIQRRRREKILMITLIISTVIQCILKRKDPTLIHDLVRYLWWGWIYSRYTRWRSGGRNW